MTDILMKRRSVIQALLAISAGGALAACSGETGGGGNSADSAALKYASEGAFLTDKEMALMGAIAQTIIPKTETAGAVEAGVPATLQALISEWADDNMRRQWRAGFASLSEYFRAKGGRDFQLKSEKQRKVLLAPYDTMVYNGKHQDPFYKDLKSMIATAYYMSEPGATEELAYEPLPGDWKGCVPLADYPVTWAL